MKKVTEKEVIVLTGRSILRLDTNSRICEELASIPENLINVRDWTICDGKLYGVGKGFSVVYDLVSARFETDANVGLRAHCKLVSTDTSVYLVGCTCNARDYLISSRLTYCHSFFGMRHFEKFKSFTLCSLVYVPGIQKVLLLGGTYGHPHQRESIGIWDFCLKTKCWTGHSEVSFGLLGCSSVLTQNEKHVVIAGGQVREVSERLSRDQVLLHLHFGYFKGGALQAEKKCSIRPPDYGDLSPEMLSLEWNSKSELVVAGWVRHAFEAADMIHAPLPSYLHSEMDCAMAQSRRIALVLQDWWETFQNQDANLSCHRNKVHFSTSKFHHVKRQQAVV